MRRIWMEKTGGGGTVLHRTTTYYAAPFSRGLFSSVSTSLLRRAWPASPSRARATAYGVQYTVCS